MKRVILILLVVVAMGCGVKAQSVSDGDWRRIDRLVENHLYDSAFYQSGEVLRGAIENKQSKDILIAVAMRAEIGSMYQENFQDSIGSWLKSVVGYLDEGHRAVWHLMVANYLHWYSSSVRGGVSNDIEEPLMMWSTKLRESEMMKHIDSALNSSELLKGFDVRDYDRVLLKRRGNCVYGVEDEPSLLEVGLRYGYELAKSVVEIDNVWSDSLLALVSPINEFGKVELDDRDSILMPLQYFQLLEKCHARGDVDKQIALYCERLDYMRNYQNVAKGIERGIRYYGVRNSKEVTILYAMLAEYYERQKNYVKALDLCNSGLRVSKDNDGAKRCAIVKDRIERVSISLSEREESLPGMAHYVDVKTRNVASLYFRLYNITSMDLGDRRMMRDLDEIDRRLDQLKKREWKMLINDKGEHKEIVSALAVENLAKGAYLLVACENARFEKDNISSVMIVKTDVSLEMQVGELKDGNRRLDIGHCGMIRDRRNGKPLEGVLVGLNVDGEVKETSTTDANGYYHFSDDVRLGRDAYVEIHDGDFVWEAKNGNRWVRGYKSEVKNEILIFRDKPVYRLGEDLNWSCVVNRFDGEDNREVLAGVDVLVELYDVNYKRIDSMVVVTDAYGRGSGKFRLPEVGMNGTYSIKLRLLGEEKGSAMEYVKVMAYKQPKFMISLLDKDEYYKVGQRILLKGRVSAYNGALMGGAIVSYRIDKRNGWYNKKNEESGQTVCDYEGGFEIPFMPKANILDGDNVEYELHVMVTDLNGETQEITKELRAVRKDKRNIVICTETNLWEWNELEFEYTNLYGDMDRGEVHVKVELLKQPIVSYLRLPLWDKERQHSMSRSAFDKVFPDYAYDVDDLEPMNWEVEKCVLDTVCKVLSEDERTKMGMPRLETGVYKVVVTDVYGTKQEKVINLNRMEAQKCQSPELLWCDVEHGSYDVGLVARVRIGSRFKGVNVVYNIVYRGRVLEQGSFVLNNEIKMLMIPIMKQHIGGFTVNFSAVYKNVGCNVTQFINVPYSEKENRIELVTFRDKLYPGDSEHWTLKSGKPNTAMVLTMYDDALSVYDKLGWNYASRLWAQNSRDARFGMYYQSVWNEEVGVGNRGYGRGGVVYSKNGVETAERVYSDGAMVGMEMEANGVDESLRSDFNSNAFFMPNLLTDTLGNVDISFDVPDLLTRWRLQGFGWTKDMAMGNIERTVVTQKDLMVIPNVPRFMRQGDRTNFSGKVVNLSEQDESVMVEFWLLNAADDSEVAHERKMISIASGESRKVNFELMVPNDMYMATYKIIVKGAHHSDGEQGQIAVLSNRQMVTESMSMYINGRGAKSYDFERLRKHDSKTLEQYGLMLEFTSNPMWYVLQTLPHVAELKSPSSLYLMNQLYINKVGAYIVENNPMIEDVFEEWDKADEGNLDRNEEIKQTSLEETPWLNQALDEKKQRRQVMQYFDSISLENLMIETQQKLIESQRADGGWSWIEGDKRSSVYVTEYILRQMGALKDMGIAMDTQWNDCLRKALAYCDKESYEYYVRLKKEDKGAEVMNIFYLYMRSYYADSKFEGVDDKGYRYFYEIALKNYENYEDLYTRAQLALIFYRHGDRKEAIDIANSLKGAALYSDEMGMYWRDNVGGYYWYDRPVETQTMLIKVFDEILGDMESVGKMQQWLLKQKQTTHWGNDVATASAVEALLSHGGTEQLADMKLVEVKVGKDKVRTNFQKGTGYMTKSWKGMDIDTSMAKISLRKATKGPAWGAMYWQYFEDLDKIEYSEMGVKMDKRYYKVDLSGELTEVGDSEMLKVGDRIRVRILIDCDRNLEYLQLKDQRPSAFEPVRTESGWNWNWREGLSYYIDVKDACNIFYINNLSKGKYVVEYDVWVTNSGEFSCGIASLQCMYAPEFRCNTQGIRIGIK